MGLGLKANERCETVNDWKVEVLDEVAYEMMLMWNLQVDKIECPGLKESTSKSGKRMSKRKVKVTTKLQSSNIANTKLQSS